MTPQEKIDKLLETAKSALAEATAIAEANGLDFYWQGPAYGMGGNYTSEGAAEKWDQSNFGWQASSNSC